MPVHTEAGGGGGGYGNDGAGKYIQTEEGKGDGDMNTCGLIWGKGGLLCFEENWKKTLW